MKKIVILGSTGMLGSAVSNYFIQRCYDVLLSTRKSKSSIENKTFVLNALANDIFIPEKTDYVINCIGIIKPLIPSMPSADVVRINSLFPHLLADYCEKNSIKLIHITTDCTFSGRKETEYTEEDIHDPPDFYGKSKSVGEPSNCMVIRTSIIGEEIHNKLSLVEWTKSQVGKKVSGYTNHLWNGVTTKQYAKICDKIIKDNLYEIGMVHVFSPSPVTKDTLLHLLNERFQLNLKIKPTAAPVPINRVLGTVKPLCGKLNIPDLQFQIREM